MSTVTEDLRINMYRTLDYTHDMFGEELELIAATMFSCIELGNRIVICSTYGNIGISDLFVQSLNTLLIKRTQNIAAYSLNSDSKYLSLLATAAGDDIFTKVYEMVSRKGDVLLLVPGKATAGDDKSRGALVSLISSAKKDGNMVICINNVPDDSYITELLDQDDLCINFSDTDEDDVSALQLMYMFQHILRSIKQLTAD